MADLGENGGLNLRYWHRDPQKALPCAELSFDIFFVRIGARDSAVAFLENSPPKKTAESLCPEGSEITHAQK